MLIKEADIKMGREGTHAKLTHEQQTRPWQLGVIDQPGVSCRQQCVAAGSREGRFRRPTSRFFACSQSILRHIVEDEFGHPTWGANVWLADMLTVEVPLYPLTRPASHGKRENRVGVGVPGAIPKRGEVGVITERGSAGHFHPAEIDVFHVR